MSSVPKKKTEIPISNISNNSYQSWSQDRKETWWTPLTVCVKKQPFFRVILKTQTMHYYLGETLKFPKKSGHSLIPHKNGYDPWFFFQRPWKKDLDVRRSSFHCAQGHLWAKVIGRSLESKKSMAKKYPPGINISHLGKRLIIFKHALGRDMLVPRRVKKLDWLVNCQF